MLPVVLFMLFTLTPSLVEVDKAILTVKTHCYYYNDCRHFSLLCTALLTTTITNYDYRGR